MQWDKVHKWGWCCLLTESRNAFFCCFGFFQYYAVQDPSSLTVSAPGQAADNKTLQEPGPPRSKQRQKWGWDVLLRVTSALAMLGCPVAYGWPFGWPRRGMVSSSTPLSHLSTLKYTSAYPRQRKSGTQFRDKPSGFSLDCASFCFNLVFWTANVFYLEIQCL